MEDLEVNFNWNATSVLVTGATGFIGHRLVRRLLDRGANVVALIRDWDPRSELVRSGDVSRLTVVQGALEDFQAVMRAVNEFETEIVFHLAAQSLVGPAFRDPLATFETNIRGTYHLLEACRRMSGGVKRVIIASSDKAYGESEVLPYTETHPLIGNHPYDVSKSCGDLIAQTYAHTYDLPIVIARFANVFGPGDTNWSRLIPGTIRSFADQKRPIIRSDGSFVRDYLYVDDVVRGYLLLAEKLELPEVRGAAFNFGTDSGYTVLEIVQHIKELMSVTDLEPVVLAQQLPEIRNQTLVSERARSILGWLPDNSLREGILKTVEWYKMRFGEA